MGGRSKGVSVSEGYRSSRTSRTSRTSQASRAQSVGVGGEVVPENDATVGSNVSVDRGLSVKRYNLLMPEDLFNRLEVLANEKQVSLAELIRTFLKIGLILVELQHDDSVSIVVRDSNRERELMFPF